MQEKKKGKVLRSAGKILLISLIFTYLYFVAGLSFYGICEITKKQFFSAVGICFELTQGIPLLITLPLVRVLIKRKPEFIKTDSYAVKLTWLVLHGLYMTLPFWFTANLIMKLVPPTWLPNGEMASLVTVFFIQASSICTAVVMSLIYIIKWLWAKTAETTKR